MPEAGKNSEQKLSRLLAKEFQESYYCQRVATAPFLCRGLFPCRGGPSWPAGAGSAGLAFQPCGVSSALVCLGRAPWHLVS